MSKKKSRPCPVCGAAPGMPCDGLGVHAARIMPPPEAPTVDIVVTRKVVAR